MSKIADMYASTYNMDTLWDFADYMGMDYDIFMEIFWHEVVEGHEKGLSPDTIYWNIWDIIDYDGDSVAYYADKEGTA